MTDLATPLLWSAVQVTALALGGLLLAALAARRGAATAALLTTLAACCGLTLLTFVPTPEWWTWETTETTSPDMRTPSDRESSSESPSTSVSETESAPHAEIDLSFLRRFVRPVMAVPRPPAWRRCTSLALWLFCAGTVLSLGRLALGCLALRRLLRRCRPVGDTALLDLVQRLRAKLGVQRAVALYESDEVTTAATVGWRRPVVVLPADWPAWNDTERRAVLAHELAHIRHGDFLARVLARVARALHFYHPLVARLVGRLEFHQELAADAVGTRLMAEPAAYLRVLAGLALRQDDRLAPWAASPFLSSPGTLLRRIRMLEARDGVRPAASRGRRAAVAFILALAALAVSAMRGPAQKSEQPPGTSQDPAVADGRLVDRPPFDLTYVAPDGHGVVAVRPAAFFTRPDAKELRETANRGIKELFTTVQPLVPGVKAGEWDLRVEDIEQIVGTVQFFAVKKGPGEGKTAMSVTRPMIRTIRDYDWSATFRRLLSEPQVTTIEGRTCYIGPKEIAPAFGGKMDVCFCIIDKRTLLIDTEVGIRAALKLAREKRKPPAWHEDWKPLERALFVHCITDIRPILAERPIPATPEPGVALLRASETLVFSLDLDTDLRWAVRGRSDTEKGAGEMLEALRDALKANNGRLKPDSVKDDIPAPARRVLNDLMTKWEVSQTGTRVHGGAVSKNVDLATVGAVVKAFEGIMP